MDNKKYYESRNIPYKTVFRYTYKDGKFIVKEVYERLGFSDYGKILQGRMSIYLPERNDELAKHIFIEYKEKRMAELRAELDKVAEQLRILKEES